MGLFCLELSAWLLWHLLVSCSPFERIECTTAFLKAKDIPLYVTKRGSDATRSRHDEEIVCVFVHLHPFVSSLSTKRHMVTMAPRRQPQASQRKGKQPAQETQDDSDEETQGGRPGSLTREVSIC